MSAEQATTHGLVLVVGPRCHLCEHGRQTLASLGLSFAEIDVTSPEAAELARRGVPLAFLPVLVQDSRLVAYGRLSLRRLRRELATREPS